MKATELIEKLQKIVVDNGNVEIYSGWFDECGELFVTTEFSISNRENIDDSDKHWTIV